jgi:S1-C subfamily serine protease
MAELRIGSTSIVSSLQTQSTNVSNLQNNIASADTNISNLQACLGSSTSDMGAVGQGGQTHYNMGSSKTLLQLLQELETQINTARTEATASETAALQHSKRQTALSDLISSAMTRVAQTRATYADDTSATGSASLISVNYQGLDLWLTNSHTVRKDGANATSLVILRPTTEIVPANIVAWDDGYDVAFFTTAPTGLQPLQLMAQEWREQPAQGTEVYMLGSPFTDKFTVTCGIVSDPGSIPELFSGAPRTHTILDIVSRSGNSGGPAIDNTGRIVSISRLGATINNETLETLGWTVPSWAIKALLEQVTVSNITGDLTPLWIPEVEIEATPAPNSGLWTGLSVTSSTNLEPESIGSKLQALGHDNEAVLESIVLDGVTYTLGFLDGQFSIHDFSYLGANATATLNYSYVDINTSNTVSDLSMPLTINTN